MNDRKRTATAKALANVALVKYFGKRDKVLNLPAQGSLSLTLEPLETVTTVEFVEGMEADEVKLGNFPAGSEFCRRVTSFLDLFRERAGISSGAVVSTDNSFPTAAGLASSASGFAALTVAAAAASGLELSSGEMSVLARRGSGSACRSIPGGVVLWQRGEKEDGSDSYAYTLSPPGEWDLRLVIGITDPSPKKIGSTSAMEITRSTSPFYSAWVDSAAQDLKEARAAVEAKDIEKLGEISERSALSMHGAALASRPGIIYWKSATVDAIHAVRELRKSGSPVWFTCDAGPQPKVLCTSDHVDEACQALSSLSGIKNIICCSLGQGAQLLEG